MKYFTILSFFVVQMVHSQDLSLVTLTKEDSGKGVQYHYQWESQDGHVAVIDLFLLKEQRFKYAIASNVYNVFSTGQWISDGKMLTLNSEYQKGTLPVQISYRKRDTADFDVRELAFVKDLNGKSLSYAFIHVNNDSITCMYGDLMCIGTYNQIESIKVVLENNGPSSKWITVAQHEGLIQITVLTKLDLARYLVLNDEKYMINGNKLSPADVK